ncbi:unnamed protein product [Caenorhabditis angaria]|uniref:Uncharacterized protein n=1 Tax=Caenorhabditis angaria TaxID=860376 RepID=A0A9P1IUF1_9PELO|nr:unnamed protein product [Caenorhabditis angaria]
MFGIFTSFALQNQENTGSVICILCTLNGLAIIEMSFLRDWNCRKHETIENNYNEYSLAERFQIVENIKALTMLKNLILYMGAMNCFLLLSLYLKSISCSVEYDLLATLILEACIFLYAFSFPHVTAKNCPRWERLLYRYLKRIRKVTFLKDTFGRKMNNQASNIDVYFNGLKVAWN